MKIAYVGLKEDGEGAFSRDTGLTWMPGDEHEVDDKIAGRMLAHPDVFAVAGSKAAKAAPKPVAQADEPPKPELLPIDDEAFAAMSDDAVREFGKEHGVKNIHHTWKGDKLRQYVRANLKA